MLGELVRIEFYDHCENGDALMQFEVIGRVIEDSELYYKVGAWLFTNEVQKAYYGEENEHTYTIGKGLIKDIQCLSLVSPS